jgi:hypothetical protein
MTVNKGTGHPVGRACVWSFPLPLDLFFVLVTVSVGFALLAGCGDLGSVVPEDLFAQDVTVSMLPIDTRCSAFIMEHISRAGNSLSIHVVSDRVYGRGGHRIAGSLKQAGVQFYLTLDSIQAPVAQGGSPSPAEGVFELGNLPPGFYPISISINGGIIHGLLRVAADAYSTSLQRNNVLSIRFPEVRRVPRAMIWGMLDVPSLSSLYVAWRFLDSLVYLGARYHDLKDGEYWYFRLEAGGHAQIALPHEQEYFHPFLFRFAPDTSVARSLVKRFAKRYPDSLTIHLYGGRGEVFLSDQLRLEP